VVPKPDYIRQSGFYYLLLVQNVQTIVCSTSAQTYSIPTPPTIDSTYAERLEHICKVWGYVKYFHAGISAVSRWDDVLVRALTETKATTNEQEYRAIVDTFS
jgi:hypothetical protein